MSADRLAPVVADYGVGTVYISLPLAEVSRERSTIQALQTARRPRGVLPDPPLISLITGQEDLAARFLVEDFRGVWNLGYPAGAPDPSSHASVYNWVYS